MKKLSVLAVVAVMVLGASLSAFATDTLNVEATVDEVYNMSVEGGGAPIAFTIDGDWFGANPLVTSHNEQNKLKVFGNRPVHIDVTTPALVLNQTVLDYQMSFASNGTGLNYNGSLPQAGGPLAGGSILSTDGTVRFSGNLNGVYFYDVDIDPDLTGFNNLFDLEAGIYNANFVFTISAQ